MGHRRFYEKCTSMYNNALKQDHLSMRDRKFEEKMYVHVQVCMKT